RPSLRVRAAPSQARLPPLPTRASRPPPARLPPLPPRAPYDSRGRGWLYSGSARRGTARGRSFVDGTSDSRRPEAATMSMQPTESRHASMPSALRYDVIVIGGGHAGIEASIAAARLGAKTALVLPNPDKIGLMPCNPAIGGPGKSQLVYELHALGGVMGRLADATAIHTRTLNASKGAAVQSLRVQNERDGYAAAARELVEGVDGIDIVRAEAADVIVEVGHVAGVRATDGRELRAPSVVLCTGTFLAGVVWYGKQQRPAGRQGEAPARHLSASLRATGHDLIRL